MNLFVLNIGFAVVFTTLLGRGTIISFLVGFFIGYLALWFSQPLYQETSYFKKLPKTINLIGYFLVELLVSNLKVLWDIITPGHINRPGIIGVPLAARTDLEIFVVANLLSLTPGTLSVDLSEDRTTLYVHVMFLDDVEQTRQAIKNGLERRVLEVMRA
ncbi:Na+/H+ antiporter subunit E [Desulfofustis limnaeus]|jgi:multicomponent Na+:H+ antiporter subunit E|uniref:Sodium:proton antiporter n=1 Tax=Desulfofustis limnaeus TaxID=2740163 RepID=A0ABM7W6M9_9BACT|nr:Na+/H+ antiporter subunit E [Desulfofustis limnaeus]MDX9894812.1 Na+/H+ antiporter subunit E [Desulfofustis sp.]BDD86500.1 sodium:proton antiporter [Desulfofustis limnaeus]